MRLIGTFLARRSAAPIPAALRRTALAAALLAAIAPTASAQLIPILKRRRPPPTDPAPAVGPVKCQNGRVRSAMRGALIGLGVASPVSVILLVRSPGRPYGWTTAVGGAAAGAVIGYVRGDDRTECQQIVHAPPPVTPNGTAADTGGAQAHPPLADAGRTGAVAPPRATVDLPTWLVADPEPRAVPSDARAASATTGRR